MEYVLRGNIRLERGDFVRIQGGSGTLVRVHSGAVWITEEGDPRDHFVPAGERFNVASNRLTLVSALGGSNLEMRTTAQAQPRRAPRPRLEKLVRARRASDHGGAMTTLYRKALPQLGDALFVTDGGIETALIFNEGIELPDFAAFDLFRRPGGEAALRRYYAAYVRIATQFRAGMMLESATWRASADWGARLGYTGSAARRGQPAGDPPARGHPPRAPRARDGDQRLRRPARRRLQPDARHVGRRGAGVPPRADRHLQRHRGGHGDARSP